MSNHRFDGDKCPKASWQALTPSLTQANTHLNFNFHCISAPNHPGKHFDPPTIKQIAHLNLDNSSLNKCPKPSWQALRPPPPNGQCPFEPGDNFGGGFPYPPASAALRPRFRPCRLKPPSAPARSCQGCAWTVIVSKLSGSLPSCSPASSLVLR